MLKLPICPHCHTVYGYREVKKIAKEKSHTCYHCKNEFRASKRPCLVLILILFVLAVAANVGVLYMSPNLNFYALVGINVIFILLFIALLMFALLLFSERIASGVTPKVRETSSIMRSTVTSGGVSLLRMSEITS